MAGMKSKKAEDIIVTHEEEKKTRGRPKAGKSSPSPVAKGKSKVNTKSSASPVAKTGKSKVRAKSSSSPEAKGKSKADDKVKGKAKAGKNKDEGKDMKVEEEAKKKKKVKKDPACPKRGLSGYMFFGNEIRPKMMIDHPEWKVGDFGIEIGRLWHLVNEKQKAKYQKLADKDKER
jgi:hypothetical protein